MVPKELEPIGKRVTVRGDSEYRNKLRRGEGYKARLISLPSRAYFCTLNLP